ncbi:MAG: hypothetical protein WCW56_03360 [Candidatus Paceibacterota bacterium]|jgi:hypothetical protein
MDPVVEKARRERGLILSEKEAGDYRRFSDIAGGGSGICLDIDDDIRLLIQPLWREIEPFNQIENGWPVINNRGQRSILSVAMVIHNSQASTG